MMPFHGASGQIDIRILHSRGYFVETDTAGSEGLGVELRPDCIFLRTEYYNLCDTVDHGYALPDKCIGIFVDLR